MERIVMCVNREEEGGEGRADEFINRYAALVNQRNSGSAETVTPEEKPEDTKETEKKPAEKTKTEKKQSGKNNSQKNKKKKKKNKKKGGSRS